MSSIVKRVAQALQQEMETAPFDETAIALARAAIAAMREPTEEMLNAGHEARAKATVNGIWHAMIDAALEGK